MSYKFATQDRNYSDFASGRVIYNLPGAPAFPVRLATEIFQRALTYHKPGTRLSVFDPCCGAAYHLTVLGFLHGKSIHSITASDINPLAVEYARRNLRLLSVQGLDQRQQEIENHLRQYGKQSHAEALESLHALREMRNIEHQQPVETQVYQADAADSKQLSTALQSRKIDIVFSDVPYGQLTGWQIGSQSALADRDPLWMMLDALIPLLQPETVIALAMDKSQKAVHTGYQRLERFQIGKRQVVILKKAAG